MAFIQMLGKALKREQLKFILVVGPSARFQPPMEPFRNEDLNSILDISDGISLMTYDYSGPHQPGPNAPVTWAESEVKRLCVPKSKVSRTVF
jgi:chitinase domain-containing protein 1